MNEAAEKLNWFNSLPSVKMRFDPPEWEQTCPCGSTIWYTSLQMTLDVQSWIETHYEHRLGKEPDEVQPELGDSEYDFSRPIKFSAAGFAVFVERFNLRKTSENELSEIYMDKSGREWHFLRHCAAHPPKNEYEGVHRIFDYESSRTKTNAK